MTMMETFNQYRDIVRQMKRLEVQLDRNTPTGAPGSVHALRYDRLPSTNDSLSARMQAVDGMEALHSQLAEELRKLQPCIDACLAQISSCQMKSIMTLYYLQGMTDEAVAESLYMDDRYVCKLRNRCLRALQEEVRSA